MDSLFLTSAVEAGIRMSIPIAFSGIGVVISEKSGVLNIGSEGEMLVGAFATFCVTYFTKNIFLGIFAGGIGGLLTALIIAFLAISRRRDQSVVGIVVNIFALGLTSFIYRVIFGNGGSALSIGTMKNVKIPGLCKIPVLGDILFNQNVLFYVVIASALISWYVMNKLKVGLQLRAVGENPRAAQSSGINVISYRYSALLISGFLSGIGGAYLVAGIMGKFTEDISAGRGFIGMAVSALCHWNPLFALLASFIFGLAQGLQMRLQVYGIGIPYQFLLMLPYVLTIVSLIIFGRGAKAPKDLGNIYEKEGR